MEERDYLARHCPIVEAALARAVNQMIDERAADPVARIGQILQAESRGPPLELPEDTALSDGNQWDLLAWTRGTGIHRVVAAALQQSAAAAAVATPAYLKGIKSRGELQRLLCIGAVAEGIVDIMWEEVQTLQRAGVAPGELASKFAGSIEMSYSGLEMFFSGLERVVGAPDPQLLDAMRREHMEGPDAHAFTTGNYGVTTTSPVEYAFVVDEAMPDAAGGAWPAESEAKMPDRSRWRQKTPLIASDCF